MMLRELKERWLEAGLILAAILTITALHYGTTTKLFGFHDFYRRLYYLPIIVAALRFGLRGGLAASLLSSILYFPHAFLLRPHLDPQNELDKVLEILLYNVVAVVTGWLYERVRDESVRHEKTAEQLKESLDRFEKIQYRLRIAERMAAVGQLSAGLAHEIRNPLASIQGTAEVLKDDFPPGHPKHKMADILIEESQRLGSTLNRFLMFAKPHRIEPTEIDLREEMRTVVELLRRSKAYADHKIGVSFGEDVSMVVADGAGLRQVLLNLGLNALEAMERGGSLSFAVERRENAAGNFIAVKISDEGGGLDAESRERMFNPFYSTKEEGTGLGLSIVQRIVEDHGGSIEVESSPGRGTSITVTIPERYIE